MRKQLFSMMLCLGAVGGASFATPMTAMAAVAQDQVITVKGQVVDDQGEPMIGATVKTKDAKTGAVTDLDGNFQIRVKANATLIVSYLGFKEREIAVRGRAILEPIQLSTNDNLLDQVVVVGYGTQKKADLTGSVSIVNAEEMKKVSNSNISTMPKVRWLVYRLHPTVSRVPTLAYVSVVSAPSVARLLSMSSTVCQWVPLSVTSLLMISRPSRF